MAAGVCTDEERQKCKIEFGNNLAWACENCPKGGEAELSEYTRKLFRLRALRLAGYPLRARDLTMEEWEDLGRVEQWERTRERSA